MISRILTFFMNHIPSVRYIILLFSLLLLFLSACKKKEEGKPKATVTFMVNGGSAIGPIEVIVGNSLTLPPAPTKPDNDFEGWYTDLALSKLFVVAEPILANITLYAKWTPTVKSFTVQFVTNGGNAITEVSVTSGNRLTKLQTPVRNGYIFKGWFSDVNLSNPFLIAQPITSNITLYAKWEQVSINSFLVTFETNGGNEILAISVTRGNTITLPPTPIRDGYIFKGWFSDSNLNNQFLITQPITSNISLHAKWEQIISNSFLVTFETNGGNPIFPIQVVNGQTITSLPDAPQKTDMLFDSWYTDRELTIKFDQSKTIITGPTTLYAKWKDLFLTVSFSYKGTVVRQVKVIKNQTLTDDQLAPPQVDYTNAYTFLGWFTDDKFTKKFLSSQPITADITLYSTLLFIQVNYTQKGLVTGVIREIRFGTESVDLVIPEEINEVILTEIASNAFEEITQLKSLVLPSTLKRIGPSAFQRCYKLRGDLIIPDGVEIIDTTAFFGCGFDGKLTIGKDVSYIGWGAFQGWCSELTAECLKLTGGVAIPDKVTYTGQFTGDITIPDKVTYIGPGAFGNNRKFNGNLYIGKAVRTIEESAFYECSNLSGSLTIPASVTFIGRNAFFNCSKLQPRVTMNPTTPPKIHPTSFDQFSGDANVVFLVPASSLGAYKAADVWKDIFSKGRYSIEAQP